MAKLSTGYIHRLHISMALRALNPPISLYIGNWLYAGCSIDALFIGDQNILAMTSTQISLK